MVVMRFALRFGIQLPVGRLAIKNGQNPIQMAMQSLLRRDILPVSSVRRYRLIPLSSRITPLYGSRSKLICRGASGISYETFDPRSLLSSSPHAIESTNSQKLMGKSGEYYLNASHINTGTLSTDRFSAFSDLQAENKIGTASDQIAAGDHGHSDITQAITNHTSDSTVHFTQTEIDHNNLQNAGTNSHAQIDLHISDGSIHQSFSNKEELDKVNQDLSMSASPAFQGISLDKMVVSDSIVISAPVVMSGQKIGDLPIPTEENDAVTKGYVDSRNSAIVSTLIGHAADESIHQSFSNKEELDKVNQDLSTNASPSFQGVTLNQMAVSDTIVISAPVMMTGQKLSDVGTPSEDNDAATKGYVDSIANMHNNDSSIHFTQSSISHTNIQDIGNNSHAQIDTHIGNDSIHQSFANKSLLDTINQPLSMSDTATFEVVAVNRIEGINGSVGISAPLTMSDHKISDLAAPTLDSDAATKGYVDNTALSLSNASNMHSNDNSIHFTESSISHANIQDIGTNSHVQIDSHISDDSIHQSFENKALLDTINQPLSMSDTATFEVVAVNHLEGINGSLVISSPVTMVGQKISDLSAPSLESDAANKGYVDSADSSMNSQLQAHTMNTSIHRPFTNARHLDTIDQDLNQLDSVTFAGVSTSELSGQSGEIFVSDTLNMAGNTITGLATPMYEGQAANKGYVDSHAGNTLIHGQINVNALYLGPASNATNAGTAFGKSANAYDRGTALGYMANGRYYGIAIGSGSNGNNRNVGIGDRANAYAGAGANSGAVAIGYRANAYSGEKPYSGGVAIGYTANAKHNFDEVCSGAVAIGRGANAFIRGVAVGHSGNTYDPEWSPSYIFRRCSGYNQGVGIGYGAFGWNAGVAVGYTANGSSTGTAIGYSANAGGQNYSFAKGAYSKCTRYNEEWKSSDGIDNRFGYGQVNFHGTTTRYGYVEIFLGGNRDETFLLKDYSVVTFRILVSAYNTSDNNVAGWEIFGVIKRRGEAHYTELMKATVTESYTSTGLTNPPQVAADAANGGLKVLVCGINYKSVIWNASMSYSEARRYSAN